MTLPRPRVFIACGVVLAVMGLSMMILSHGDLTPADGAAIENTHTEPDVLFQPVEGMVRPDFSIADLDGRMRSISEWDGKVVLINFWATWCLPCLTEIPELLELQNNYGEQGLQVIGIALQKPEEVSSFVAEHNMTYPVMAGEAEVIVIAESYGNRIGALPYTAIINRDGTVAFTRAGPISREEVQDLIEDLLM